MSAGDRLAEPDLPIPDPLAEEFVRLEGEVAERARKARQAACPHAETTRQEIVGRRDPVVICLACGAAVAAQPAQQ